MNHEIKILINNGEVFDGNFNQFENCFFVFSGTNLGDKMVEIIMWAADNGYTFTFTDDVA